MARATRPDAAPTLLITIFVGANDACLPPVSAHVPLPRFEQNIRGFVDAVLGADRLSDTKIVLITPPPINIPDPLPASIGLGPADLAAAKWDPREGVGYKTYLSKRRYARNIMEVASSYEETGRVAGLDLWTALVDAGLEDQGRMGDEDKYDEERLPGCGLPTAKAFKKGYFTDGLHLNGLVSQRMSALISGHGILTQALGL